MRILIEEEMTPDYIFEFSQRVKLVSGHIIKTTADFKVLTMWLPNFACPYRGHAFA